jgi:hypothetical protein
MMLAMHSLEDDLLDVRLQTAVADNHLVRLGGAAAARGIEDLARRADALLAAAGHAIAEGGAAGAEDGAAGGGVAAPLAANGLAA